MNPKASPDADDVIIIRSTGNRARNFKARRKHCPAKLFSPGNQALLVNIGWESKKQRVLIIILVSYRSDCVSWYYLVYLRIRSKQDSLRHY